MSFLHTQKANWQKNAFKVVLFAASLGLFNGLFQFTSIFAPKEVQAMEFFNLQNANFYQIYTATIGLLSIVIPSALSWYVRTYLKSAENQKRLSMIATLASTAINYAEDCERRGERELAYNSLDLPDNLARNPSPGHQKLCLASSWLVEELKRLGIKRVSIEEAVKWVAAEFQKTVGDMRTIHSVTTLTDLAADLLNQLNRNGHITLPSNTLEAAALIQSIADWATNQLGDQLADNKENKVLQRETAMSRIAPTTLMMPRGNNGNHNGNNNGNYNGNNSENSKISPEMRLTLLARQASDFVKDLQKRDRLRMSEKDTAIAWLIQKVQQDDIPVTRDQIGDAISLALEPKRA